MELSISRNGSHIHLTAAGAITTTQDAMEFKKVLNQEIRGLESGTITIDIPDSYLLPSSIIGLLLQLAEIDHHTIELNARQADLRESLRKLGLAQILGVKGA